ncbi:reverse transcriptase [Cucumis melo var. makuwa]|uniref:Reverse transcriptase n=1 Tax=Cucumis melo var. makuwa TaxID=1194695 RepID=A0A5A7V9L8_CUCMM|nr:reverse transcriptase [Cucumis melo var. makuwa]TYK11312.1 reverse transcriptase [Cucumis melo var. makuwa]
MPHTPLLSDVWAYTLSPFHLTAQPIPFYAPVGYSTVKPFLPSASSRATYELRTATLNRKYVKSVLSDIEADESSTHSTPTENSDLIPNLILFVVLGQRPHPSLMEVCFEVCLEEDHTNVMGVLTTPTIDLLPLALGPQIMTVTRIMERGKKWSSKEKQNSGRAYISETTPASTSQSTDPTTSQTKTLTLGTIAQSGMPQSFGLISVDGKNSWILDSRATYHLTGSLEHFISYAPCAAAHLINRMPSHILHLQTLLDCLKESYPSTRLVFEVPLHVFGCTAYVHNFGRNQTKFTPRAQACVFVGYPPHQRGYKYFHPSSKKYFVTMDVTFCENQPYFPVSYLQGKSVSEEFNNTFEFIESTPSTVSDVDPHPIILPTNQVPWKTYYRRNLKKEGGSPTSQPLALVQDFKPPRGQGMENPTEPCTNNTMSENDRSDVAVLENMEEKNRGDETKVRIETSNDEAEQGHTRKLDEYDPSFDIHSHCFEKRAFTASLDSTIILKNIYTALEYDQTEISKLKQRIDDEFEIKDLGNLKYFLGMEVARSKEGISVSQRKYTLDLLTEIGMLGCRLADTPIEFNSKLGNFDDQVPVDKEQYQRLVDKLIYLSHTCPDICFAGSLVTWRSKKQSVVTRSSAEAEYRAMSLGIYEEIWLQKVLTKHVEIDRHFIKERLDNGSICIPYIPSSQQVADVLTKGLLRPHFDLCVSKLGLIDIYVPT